MLFKKVCCRGKDVFINKSKGSKFVILKQVKKRFKVSRDVVNGGFGLFEIVGVVDDMFDKLIKKNVMFSYVLEEFDNNVLLQSRKFRKIRKVCLFSELLSIKSKDISSKRELIRGRK